MFRRLYPGLPYSELRKSIDKRVTLVAYNKQEIKHLGQCCVNVCNSSTSKSKTCKFFVVEDKCNPIIGLNDSIALQLLSVNVPFTDKWTGNVHSKRSNSRCDEMETEEIGQQKGQWTGNGQVMCTLKDLILDMMRWRLKRLVSKKANGQVMDR